MRKLFLLLTATILCTGMWALDHVSYIDAEGNAQMANNVTEITNTSSTLDAGWYVVTGEDVQTAGLVCNGEVHLILADGAKLTTIGGKDKAGIQVSGMTTGNSLTIYGQSEQRGQLFVQGGDNGAGIGGGDEEMGANIYIYGGHVDVWAGQRTDMESRFISPSAIGEGTMYFMISRQSHDIYVSDKLALAADGVYINHTSSEDLAIALYKTEHVTIGLLRVTLDMQGGHDGTTEIIATYREAMPTITVPTREYDIFLGYFSERHGAGTKYYNADGTSAHNCDIVASTTLYAHWDVRVPYVDEDGTIQVKHDVVEIAGNVEQVSWATGWYVARGEIALEMGAVCTGDVHLILADGAKLTATGEWGYAGIQVSAEDASLTIYGQVNQSGQLITSGGVYGAGIGGGYEGKGHNITIYGGVIKATAGDLASAIGGKDSSFIEDIHIHSSLVLYADGNNPPTTLILHTTDEDLSNVLTGKTYAMVRKPVQGITVTLDRQEGTGGTEQVTVNEGALMPTITPPTRGYDGFYGYFSEPQGMGTQYYHADGTSAHPWDIVDNTTLYACWKNAVPYIDAEGTTQYVGIYEELVSSNANATSTLRDGWYVASGDLQMGALVCEGSVNLILTDDAKMKVQAAETGKAGIRVSGEGNSLTIYGQEGQLGELTATGGEKHSAGEGGGSGIGGGDKEPGAHITINGGIITANAKSGAAGIGGGRSSSGTYITINRGTVTANGHLGAGIGGGYGGAGEYITINGGHVTAIGGSSGAGIGGGSGAWGRHITITGGDIMANGEGKDNLGGTGIGAGYEGSAEDIRISGGTITAIGGRSPGIGASFMGTCSNVFVMEHLVLLADNNNPPTKYIAHSDQKDMSSWLMDKKYAMVRKRVEGITVALDNQGGTGSVDQVTTAEGAVLPTIAIPTRDDGYVFQGYFAAPNGKGTKYYNADGTGADPWGSSVGGTIYAFWDLPVSYIDADGIEKYVSIYTELADTTTILNDGWYIVRGELTLHSLICHGDVKLILKDGAKLTTNGRSSRAGIEVSAENVSLTIYGQSGQSGQLIAKGDIRCAGIGGRTDTAGGNVTINGGIISAEGGNLGANGIGGGEGAGGYNIVINGGVVNIGGAPSAIGGEGSHDIYVRESLILKVNEYFSPPTIVIPHTSDEDLAEKLSGQRAVSIEWGTRPVPTEIENVSGNENANENANKVLRDGVLYIIKGARTYNAQGVLVE